MDDYHRHTLQSPACTTSSDRRNDPGIGSEIMSTQKKSWRWAYQKIRSYHVSRLPAAYRATRFHLLGDTGTFTSHGGFRKSRIRH